VDTGNKAGVNQLLRKQSLGKPRGFRDILFAEAARRERLVAKISSCFSKARYELVETPSVEYPETLLRGQSKANDIGAVGDDSNLRDTFRFVDVDGNLIALRSDVTGSLARVVATRFSLVEPPYRLRYVADVFREQESLRGSDRQFTQLGLECFGLERKFADEEVLCLALDGMKAAGIDDCRLHLNSVAVFGAILETANADADWKRSFLSAWSNGDFIKVKKLALDGTLSKEDAYAVKKLAGLRGGLAVLDEAEVLLKNNSKALESLSDLRVSYASLVQKLGSDDSQKLIVDFSLAPHFEYYSGIIFELYATSAAGRAHLVGGGGRYDRLMEQFGCKMPAAGFSYDLAALERVIASYEGESLEGSVENSVSREEGKAPPLRIAVPKGKLYDDCIDLLNQAGVSLPGLEDPGRSLRIVNDYYDIIIAKPTDVAIYVSRGAADIGISGRDTLVEADFPLLQLADLEFGGCEFVVAAPDSLDCSLDELSLRLGTIRVATKYPRLTQQFFDDRGIQVEIVKLNGNIELAPLIGIADVVVDITQTGTTLRENNLRIVERVLPSTARFVAQYSAARTDLRVMELVGRLEGVLRTCSSGNGNEEGSPL